MFILHAPSPGVPLIAGRAQVAPQLAWTCNRDSTNTADMTSTSQKYAEYAARCIDAAQKSTRSEDRVKFLGMAQAWRELAEKLSHVEGLIFPKLNKGATHKSVSGRALADRRLSLKKHMGTAQLACSIPWRWADFDVNYKFPWAWNASN
jgi:hypothetical protein